MEIVLAPNVHLQRVGEESVILDLENGQYYELNDVATLILERLLERGALEEVVVEVAREYEVEDGALNPDIRALIAELEGHGLVARANG